jgi:hypothetical protein
MNIKVVSVLDNAQSLFTEFNDCVFDFKTHNSNTDKSFLITAALEIDQEIYYQRQTVDYVLLLTNPVHKFSTFKHMQQFLVDESETIYFTDERSPCNFYAKPEAFSMIASMYKLPLETYHFSNNKTEFSNIIFMINRLGLKFRNIP